MYASSLGVQLAEKAIPGETYVGIERQTQLFVIVTSFSNEIHMNRMEIFELITQFNT